MPGIRTLLRPRWLVLAALAALLATALLAVGSASAADPSAAPAATAAAAATAAVTAPAATQPLAAGESPAPSATPEPQPLQAAQPTDPWSTLNWLFTPIFQTLFLILAGFYAITGNVVIAIIALTLIIRLVTFRLSMRQIVSQQRMQKVAPELRALTKELERRHKGDRQAVYQATQAFYKERGVSPTSGCLPSLLQMGMLIPMYSVIRIGLTNYDPSAMLGVFGVKLVPLTCPSHFDAAHQVIKSLPCIDTVVAGIDMGKEQVLFTLSLIGFPLGVSILAIIAAALQVVQSRMMMPPAAENDPSASTQRSMMIFMPLISILYGGVLPAGLFVYWIVTSLFSIVQQYLIIGWGATFPIFGWRPAFAQNITPRFPVTMPEPADAGKSLAATRYKPEERWASAASTVRPKPHRRASRRGRRR